MPLLQNRNTPFSRALSAKSRFFSERWWWMCGWEVASRSRQCLERWNCHGDFLFFPSLSNSVKEHVVEWQLYVHNIRFSVHDAFSHILSCVPFNFFHFKGFPHNKRLFFQCYCSFTPCYNPYRAHNWAYYQTIARRENGLFCNSGVHQSSKWYLLRG